MAKAYKKYMIGTVVAGAAGFVAGLLTAPKSGKETRADIRAAAVSTRSEAERQLKRVHTELDALLKEAKSRSDQLSKKAQTQLEEAVQNAKKTKDKARVILSAVHEGDAEDKDLRKAIKEANNAIEHIKKYLQK